MDLYNRQVSGIDHTLRVHGIRIFDRINFDFGFALILLWDTNCLKSAILKQMYGSA